MIRCAYTLLWALSLFSLIGCSGENDVVAADYKVNVLGCYFPVPSHYVLNARTDEYYFYDSTGDRYGSITIRGYDEKDLQELLDISEVLGREEKDGRVAMLISMHLDGAEIGGLRTAFLHDYDRIVRIHGDEVPNWNAIFDACIANPSPKKPSAHPEIDRVIRDTIEELLPTST